MQLVGRICSEAVIVHEPPVVDEVVEAGTEVIVEELEDVCEEY